MMLILPISSWVVVGSPAVRPVSNFKIIGHRKGVLADQQFVIPGCSSTVYRYVLPVHIICINDSILLYLSQLKMPDTLITNNKTDWDISAVHYTAVHTHTHTLSEFKLLHGSGIKDPFAPKVTGSGDLPVSLYVLSYLPKLNYCNILALHPHFAGYTLLLFLLGSTAQEVKLRIFSVDF